MKSTRAVHGKRLLPRSIGSRAARPSNLISVAEHASIDLPADIISASGKLDIYDDVQKYFRIGFRAGRPYLQTTGVIGYVPLNGSYGVSVEPRVPIQNLECIVSKADQSPLLQLRNYTREFAYSDDVPLSILDLLAEQLVILFARITDRGLVADYISDEVFEQAPRGKINAWKSAVTSRTAGKPLAYCSTFKRTTDIPANRALKAAVLSLLAQCDRLPTSLVKPARMAALKKCLRTIQDVTAVHDASLDQAKLAAFLRRVPSQHSHYIDGLVLAGLVISKQGISFRTLAGDAALPSVLIEMDSIFESYARRVLMTGLAGEISVLDGNISGDGGAKAMLYEAAPPDQKNPFVTPDIVLKKEGIVRIVIDVKYKPPGELPSREDLNQIIAYAVRYGCKNGMLLYPARRHDKPSIQLIGELAGISIYMGHLDLSAPDIDAEEKLFVTEMRRFSN